MKKYFKILRKCPLFDCIQDENIIPMLNCLEAKVAEYKKNDIVFFEGEPAKHFGIILSGAVQIVRIDYYGNKSIVANLTAPHIFGETFSCANVKNIPVNVIASQDSQVMLIDAHRITSSCSNACDFHNQMVFNFLRIIATKNLMLNQKLEILSKRTTRQKLMTYLLSVAKQQNSNAFTIPYDRQALADYLEVDRSGLSCEIGKLRQEGILKSHKSEFVLL